MTEVQENGFLYRYMTYDITLTPVNAIWMRVDAHESILREVNDYFTYDVAGAAHIKRQSRYKGWDGKIHLFRMRSRTIYRGLHTRVLVFLQERGYSILDNVAVSSPPLDTTTLTSAITSLKLPVVPREYQLASFFHLLQHERGIVVSPTGSGKSLIIYLLVRALLHEHILIIVPTVNLVTQMSNDFKEYGYTGTVQTITAGKTKAITQPVVCSTWQSIYDMPESFFAQFNAVICDEVHLAKAKSLTGIMERTNAQYRIGFTGTLVDTPVHQLVLEGLYGPVFKAVSTKTLIDRQELSNVHVHMCGITYDHNTCQQHRHDAYQDELDFLVSIPERTEYIAKLCATTQGPTMVLATYVSKHTVPLFNAITTHCPNRNVYYIVGETDDEERELIRQTVIKSDGEPIIVGSYGVLQLGLNIPNLTNLILASPSKSRIRVLQSVGRILRGDKDKLCAHVYDIVDDLRIQRHTNFTFKHAQERLQYYNQERFPITMSVISLNLPQTSLTSI